MTTRRRSQAERDEIPVEIGYALLSACFLGGLVLATIAGPTLIWELPAALDEFLWTAGMWTAGILAVIRVIHVLWRHAQRR
ncbi:DUF6332 family protein, partial [Streptomyces sp. NRRL F-2664]|uniref:DUF6332 family protein n=1 Tax=Streptomyces sp. NRRL F-2664 TaxID=1463842 RepID=UPI0004CAC472